MSLVKIHYRVGDNPAIPASRSAWNIAREVAENVGSEFVIDATEVENYYSGWDLTVNACPAAVRLHHVAPQEFIDVAFDGMLRDFYDIREVTLVELLDG